MEVRYEKEYEFSIEELKEIIKIFSYRILAIFIFLAAIMLGLGVYYVFRAFDGEFSIGTLVCALLLIAASIAYVALGVKNHKKALSRVKGAEKYSYKFYDEELVLLYTAPDASGNMTFKYEDVKKCRRKKKYTLIIVDRNALPLRNNDLDEEFISFLKNKIKNFKG